MKATNVDGETEPAKDWVPASGRPPLLRGACVTKAGREIGAIVRWMDEGTKEALCLASGPGYRTGAEVMKRSGKLFTIEESFRDWKTSTSARGL